MRRCSSLVIRHLNWDLFFPFSFSIVLSCSLLFLLYVFSLQLLMFWCVVCMRALMLMMMGCCVFTNFTFIQYSAYKSSAFMATSFWAFVNFFRIIPFEMVENDYYYWTLLPPKFRRIAINVRIVYSWIVMQYLINNRWQFNWKWNWMKPFSMEHKSMSDFSLTHKENETIFNGKRVLAY